MKKVYICALMSFVTGTAGTTIGFRFPDSMDRKRVLYVRINKTLA